MTQAFNRDCMEAMKEFPDNYFELAVVDPPYGSGEAPEFIDCSSRERERERERTEV